MLKFQQMSARATKFAAKLIANGFNASQAVIDARITTNRKSATVIGWRMIRDPAVKKAIAKHMEHVKIDADEIMTELSGMARAPVDKVSEAGKLKALELAGKALKLFVDRVESTDTTERDSFALTLYAHITDAVRVKVGATEWAMMSDSERERLEGEGAIALHATMARTNHPTLAATSAWGKWQATIEANLAAVPEPAITEIGDQ